MILIDGVEIPVSYGDIPRIIGHFFTNDPVYQSAMLRNCLMGIAFAILGVWGILRRTNKETTGPKLVDLE